ncbi:MAG: T9SS type A sorting domain-containing protein [Flavobacteriales bacterium]|nr:T9SS type A sorting domain-containing protein [Flavobacteriales bacterium]
MKKLFALLAVVAIFNFTNELHSQARIISTGGPFMVMDGGVYLVVENTNPAAIAPSSGAPDLNLVSEDENNIVKWYMDPVGNVGANHQIPFTDTNGDYARIVTRFPNAASAGTPGANFHMQFSSYGTPPGNTPLPSLVTHLTNYNVAIATPGVQGNTANAPNTVDRFWFMEMFDFTASPEPNLRFAVPLAEQDGITTGNVMVQRFNESANLWADWFSPTTLLSASPFFTTAGTDIPTGEFYKTWTLTSFDEPLSVELLNFTAECENAGATIKWSTASEQNSDYFTVERSNDGTFWETVTEIDAAGSSSSLINYEVTDEYAANGINYYKVIETDVNGVKTQFGPVSTSCGTNVFEIVNVINDFSDNSPLDLVINSSSDKIASIKIIDIAGKLVYDQANTTIPEGLSTISLNKSDLSMGVYFIAVQTEDELLGRKVILN